MNRDLPTFCFRGNRTYVHGTDICSALSDYITNSLGAPGINSVDIIFHKRTARNLQLEVFLNVNITDKRNAVSTVTFKKNDNQYIFLCKESIRDIECRTDYHEESIIEQCTILATDKAITLESPVNFNIFQSTVAMTKALHHAIFPDIKGKWMFTRLQTDKLIATNQQYRKIVISHTHNFNYRLTKNEIHIDGEQIGSIYFSLI